ncbi:MAG: class I SAM-dependent methyltransferase [Caulobacteraceae bacterium]
MTGQVRGLYGVPAPGVIAPEPDAVQLSPLVPGAQAIEALADAALAGLTIAAPPGALERRYVLAQGLRALAPGAPLCALAPKDRGGARLRAELEALGCVVEEEARRHHRICRCRRPDAPEGLDAAIAAGGPQRIEATGLWTQPGIFSWDRVDPGSALLMRTLPALAGRGADLGCGVGVLALRVLESPAVAALALVDLDRRAVEAARRNLAGEARADVAWADALSPGATPEGLDFVVMNPPFHDGGAEDRRLGQAFVAAAARGLRPGGMLWMVANRHLPYERPLAERFARVALRAEAGGYKVHEAVR